MFFDIMIKVFVNIILCYGDSMPDLFGQCKAYYSTVEAQESGTLYCHMLVWLRGNPLP